jgi:hypothetical protein
MLSIFTAGRYSTCLVVALCPNQFPAESGHRSAALNLTFFKHFAYKFTRNILWQPCGTFK